MVFVYIALAAALIAAALLTYCFIRVFFSVRSAHADPFEIPKGEQYREYKDDIELMVNKILAVPYEDVYIKSYDGKVLHGRYYPSGRENGPTGIFFHGYRANYIRDGMGAQEMMNNRGINALLCEARGHGESEGHTITFGVRESRDVVSWVNFALERNGKDSEVMLMGLSMGAATVLSSLAREDMPHNVKSVLADCPYSTPKDILRSVVKSMRLPPDITYGFIRLSARIFGGFDPEEASAFNGVENANAHVFLVHGTKDTLVPYEMSQRLKERCKSPCKLLTVEGAEHGMSFHIDKEGYIALVNEAADVLDTSIPLKKEDK